MHNSDCSANYRPGNISYRIAHSHTFTHIKHTACNLPSKVIFFLQIARPCS
nr:MAG TPA: hypothetical protein [Caudoviricetes sp.]